MKLLDIHWKDVGADIATLLTVAGVLAYFFRPWLDKMWMASMKRNRNNVTTCLDEWYGVPEGNKKFMEHVRRLEDVEERMGDAGKRLGEELAKIVNSQNESGRQLAETLKAVHEESRVTGQAVANIYGMLDKKPWDGNERRHEERRDKHDRD